MEMPVRTCQGTLLKGGGFPFTTTQLRQSSKQTALTEGCARGQRATTIEARSGRLRHLLHVAEAELKRLEVPLVFTRLLHEALFAASAFTFY
eukprot:1842018-Pyramimonas_sp.AAC.1